MATHSSKLPGKSHGQKSLVGYSPWSHNESDMSKQLSIHIYTLPFKYFKNWAVIPHNNILCLFLQFFINAKFRIHILLLLNLVCEIKSTDTSALKK